MVSGPVERDGQRVAQIGHEREVEQLGDIDFVVQPAGVGAVVALPHLRHLAPVRVGVRAGLARRLGERDLGLLFDPIPLEPTLGSPFIGHRDRPDGAADRTHEREYQPPEVARELI